MLQAVLGLDITWRNLERLPAGRHVMVSNHSTTGDLMVLYSLPRRCVHLVNAALPARVTQVCWGTSPVLLTFPNRKCSFERRCMHMAGLNNRLLGLIVFAEQCPMGSQSDYRVVWGRAMCVFVFGVIERGWGIG